MALDTRSDCFYVACSLFRRRFGIDRSSEYYGYFNRPPGNSFWCAVAGTGSGSACSESIAALRCVCGGLRHLGFNLSGNTDWRRILPTAPACRLAPFHFRFAFLPLAALEDGRSPLMGPLADRYH